MADPNLSLASAMTAPEDGLDSTQVIKCQYYSTLFGVVPCTAIYTVYLSYNAKCARVHPSR